MRDLAELNINEGGEPVERPAPTAGQIEAFERAFGVKLPDDYLTLLRHANGGSPEVDSIDPAEGGEVASWAVDHFLFLTDNRDSLEGLWSQAKAWGKVLGPGVIPIAFDGGGSPFVLDFSTTPARVRGCIHDEDFEMVDLASSFGAFIDALYIDPDMI